MCTYWVHTSEKHSYTGCIPQKNVHTLGAHLRKNAYTGCIPQKNVHTLSGHLRKKKQLCHPVEFNGEGPQETDHSL